MKYTSKVIQILKKKKRTESFEVPELRQLYVELTNRCNLKCMMCARRYTKVDLGNFSLKNFHKLLPVIKNCQAIALSGWGESLVHPDFLEFLNSLPVNGPQIEFTTNGQLLTDNIIKQFSIFV